MSSEFAWEDLTRRSGDLTVRIADHTFLPSLMGPSPLVLDIGANQGKFARAMVKRFGCTVHAVEPNPYLCAELQRLTIPGVTVHEVALAQSSGVKSFALSKNTESSHFSSPGEPGIQVETCTLADLVSQLPVVSIDLIKMDIEGAELDVLEYLPLEVLLRIKQITVEFHQFVYPESHLRVEAVKERFREAGFWVIDFSRINYDVLFVHPSARPDLLLRASILFEKYRNRIERKLSQWSAEPGGLR